MATNGTPIKAYGQQRREIKIGGKSYSFIFLIAQVSRPILGLDLLQNYKMTIDLCDRRLLHSGTAMRFLSTSSRISGVNVVYYSQFARLLEEFPEITATALASCTMKHGIECFINTTWSPIRTAPRRLSPDKLKVAKKYFKMMCAAGICGRSDLPWSSVLHLVPKNGLDFAAVRGLTPA